MPTLPMFHDQNQFRPFEVRRQKRLGNMPTKINAEIRCSLTGCWRCSLAWQGD